MKYVTPKLFLLFLLLTCCLLTMAADDTPPPPRIQAITKGGAWPQFPYSGAFNVQVVNQKAYVSLGGFGGLAVLDVSNPAHFDLLGIYQSTGYIFKAEVAFPYAFLTDANYGIRVLDVSNPTNLSYITGYPLAGAWGAKLAGNYLYVTADAGLYVLDVTIPQQPSLAGYHATLGIPEEVDVSGSYAYVTGKKGLECFDVSNPNAITRVSSSEAFPWAKAIQIVGQYAYVGNLGRLSILNISNASLDNVVGSYNGCDEVLGFCVSGNYAYVSDRFRGMHVLDISTPTFPRLVRFVQTNSIGITVSSNTLYVGAGGSGLLSFDITAPGDPLFRTQFDTAISFDAGCAAGSLLYCIDDEGLLEILDTANIPNIRHLATYTNQGFSGAISVVSNTVFLANSVAGLTVLDVSKPTNPVFLAQSDYLGSVADV